MGGPRLVSKKVRSNHMPVPVQVLHYHALRKVISGRPRLLLKSRAFAKTQVS